ncbi:MAG: hypothetical protein MZV63_44070 [Marinilabiliales bacterium]|nr:hypothetical protein [Marinilabiliales bacterium]
MYQVGKPYESGRRIHGGGLRVSRGKKTVSPPGRHRDYEQGGDPTHARLVPGGFRRHSRHARLVVRG